MLGALIGAGASLLGGIFGAKSASSGQSSANRTNLAIADMTNRANIDMVNSANAANAALARENREFQADFARENRDWERAWEIERATNAHQWAMQDLEAAGLNPILAAGQGAQTGGINANAVSQQAPTMQAATMQRAEVQNANALSSQIYASSAKEIFNMIAASKRLNIDNKVADSQVGLNSAQSANLGANTKYRERELAIDMPGLHAQTAISSAKQHEATAKHLFKQIDHLDVDMRKTEHEIKRIEADIRYTKAMENKAYSEVLLNNLNQELVAANTRLVQANEANVYLNMAISQLGIPEASARSHIASSVNWLMNLPADIRDDFVKRLESHLEGLREKKQNKPDFVHVDPPYW